MLKVHIDLFTNGLETLISKIRFREGLEFTSNEWS
jgi:hypothetical protein